MAAEKRLRQARSSRVSDRELTHPISTALRSTGVNILGDVPWGSHICIFYESKDDLLDIAAPFFKTGLLRNEFCLWAPSGPVTVLEAHKGLGRRIADFDRYLAAGSMEIVAGLDWYLKDGRFELQRIIGAWDEKLRRALAKGYDGIRVGGDTFWLHAGYWKDFCDYERALHASIGGRSMIVLCTYPITRSGAADVLEVARAHHFAVARRNGDWEVIEPATPTASERSLSPREREVLRWAAQGKSAWEIGKILRVAKRTVDAHTRNAIGKLGAANRTQAVAIAVRERLIERTPL
jgi:DNA-binding CsgD family transcriptional regulator